MKNILYNNAFARRIAAILTSIFMVLLAAAPALVLAAPIASLPPTATITSPANLATVSGAISVTANATDPFSSCVVTISGQLYDVSTLQGTHPGGNIFLCGTDMTATYQSQHGTDLTRMQQYLIESSSIGVTKVEFYLDGILVSTDTTSPYVFSWNTLLAMNGTHSLQAKSYDHKDGNIGSSAIVNVTVNNATSDITPPVVVLVAPIASATVTGTVAVASSISDGSDIAKSELYVDGALVATLISPPLYSFSWNSASVSNGAHALMIKAYDMAGNVGSSNPVNIVTNNIIDATAPFAEITAPAGGSTVSGSSVVVDVNATDATGVTKVELYVDGVLKATDTTSSYSFTLDTTTLSNASHALMAKAYDAAGNVGSSAVVNVTVNNIVVTPGGDDNDEDHHEDEDRHVDEDQHNGNDEDSHADEDHHEDEDRGSHYSQHEEYENQGQGNQEEDED